MTRTKIRKSNWETIAFMLIRNIAEPDRPHFTRTQLMTTDNLTLGIKISNALGHKKQPTHPVETLQKTIQTLRNQGYIEFLGNGNYKMTPKGFERMNEEYQATVSYFEPILEEMRKEAQDAADRK